MGIYIREEKVHGIKKTTAVAEWKQSSKQGRKIGMNGDSECY